MSKSIAAPVAAPIAAPVAAPVAAPAKFDVAALAKQVVNGEVNVIHRTHAAAVAKELFGSHAVAVASLSRNKADMRQAFVNLAFSFFITGASSNEKSRFTAFRALAETSADWSVTSKGKGRNDFTKCVVALGDIAQCGVNAFKKTGDISLTSESFAAAIAAPAEKAEVTQEANEGEGEGENAPEMTPEQEAEAKAKLEAENKAKLEAETVAKRNTNIGDFFTLARELGVRLTPEQLTILAIVPELKKAA